MTRNTKIVIAGVTLATGLLVGVVAYAALTTYMGLNLPVVGVDSNTTAANKINAAFITVDSHNHTSGKGALVPSAGLNINANLPFNNFSATNLTSSRYADQSALSSVQSLYSVGGNLFWNDGSATAIQLTSGGSINNPCAAGDCGITGLPSGTASATYSSGAGSFVWQQATNKAATMDGGALIIRSTSGTGNNGITISSPITGATAGYSLTLPSARPAVGTKIMTMASTGTIAAVYDVDNSTIDISSNLIEVKNLGITNAKMANVSVDTAQLVSSSVTTAKIAALNVTRPKLEAVGQQIFAFTNDTNTFSSLQPVSNATVTLTNTTGRPIIVFVAPQPGASAGYVSASSTNSAQAIGAFAVGITGTATTTVGYTEFGCGGTPGSVLCVAPASTVYAIYPATAGTYVLRLYSKVVSGTSVSVTNCELVAYEM